MPSLTVDVLLSVILLGGAYILFGRQGAATTASKSAGKKKKRSKASKGDNAQAPPSDNSAKATNGEVNSKSSKPKGNALNDTSSANASTQVTRQATAKGNNVRQPEEEEEEFPPLSSSAPSKSVKAPSKQVPLAERLAKPRPKTAVDDMVEKDDELQGQKIYSRTMRIVKPQETKPLLLDENDDDDWEQPEKEQAVDSAWQSVPVTSKKSSTIRISNTTSNQPLPQTASRSIPGLTEQTKKQRQNARKAAELKAAKEEAEHERLQRLAAHKRALERERMEEQNKPKGRQPAPQVQKSKREDVGGGMRAAVHDGKLIWE